MSFTNNKLNHLLETKRQIKEAIRAKGVAVGDDDTFRSYAEKIEGISADVRYVTFMSYDGKVVCGKIPVAVGYDCPSPKFTSTRESTEQYDYTLDGWSTTLNGAADANWNKSITEDKTVYAHHKAEVRYYTITYLDEDGSILHTQTVAYGAIPPSYTPEKNGFNFDGWDRAVTAVYGDASYTAKWTTSVTFASGTWDEIVAVAKSGNAAKTFAVGNERAVTFTYADGTTEENALIVAGFDHLTTADKGKSNIVLVLKHALKNKKVFESTYSSFGTRYSACDLNEYLNGTVISGLPEAVQSAIKEINLESYGDAPAKLWVPALSNLGLTKDTFYDFSSAIESLPLFTSNASRIRTLGIGGAATTYWTRNKKQDSSYIAYIEESGGVYGNSNKNGYTSESASHGVVFGFCI